MHDDPSMTADVPAQYTFDAGVTLDRADAGRRLAQRRPGEVADAGPERSKVIAMNSGTERGPGSGRR
jgi:hypothetical protein